VEGTEVVADTKAAATAKAAAAADEAAKAATKAATAATKAQETAAAAKAAAKTAGEARRVRAVAKAEAVAVAEAQLVAMRHLRGTLIKVCKGGREGHSSIPPAGAAGWPSCTYGLQTPATENHVQQWNDAGVVTGLIAAASGKLTADRLDRLRGVLTGTGAKSAVQLARQLASVPAALRVEKKPMRAADGVWVHRVWAALAGEAAASLGDCFAGSIGHEVRLSTYDLPGYTTVADFAHIESEDPRDGNVVNARVKAAVKSDWEEVLATGVAIAEECNCMALLHMFTVHGADKLLTVNGKWSYCLASDGYFAFVVRTSVDADPADKAVYLTTRVSPPLPLWPADIMTAAYPEWHTMWGSVAAAASGDGSGSGSGAAGGSAAAGGDGSGAYGSDEDYEYGGAAAAAREAEAAAAGAAAAVQAAIAEVPRSVGIPAGLLALACLCVADRGFLGNRDVPSPTVAALTGITPALDSSGAAIVPPLPPPSEWAFVGAGEFADVYRVAWGGTPCVVKVYRHATTREHSLWPEAAAYHKLAGVPGVPRAHGGAWSAVGSNAGRRHLHALLLSPAGVMLHNALAGLSFLERLAVVGHAAAAVLRVLVAAHELGMAHGGVRPSSVIVLPASIAAVRAAAEAASFAAMRAGRIPRPRAPAAAAAAAGDAVPATIAVLSDWERAVLARASDDQKAADVTAALALLHVALPVTARRAKTAKEVCSAITAALAGEKSPARHTVTPCVSHVYALEKSKAAELLPRMESLAMWLTPYLPVRWE